MTDNRNDCEQKISILEQQIQQLRQRQSQQEQQLQPTTTIDNNHNILFQMASILHMRYTKYERLYERIPLRIMDGIRVDVFLKTLKNHTNRHDVLSLLIEDTMPESFDDCIGYHEYFRKDFRLKSREIGEIERVITEVVKIIGNLEFCRLHGRFMEKGKEPPDTSLLWKQLIVGTDHIKWKVNECPACMEETFSTTVCDHALCRHCFQKLVKPECPTCRQPLYVPEDDDDDSSEDDD